MLPEELLDVVLECLAYDKDDIVEREQPDFHFNHATNAIRALSLVDRQLRRISLPFLFSYVLVLGVDELYRFRDQCFLSPHFAACINTLEVGRKSRFVLPNEEYSDVILALLPWLTRLSWIDLSRASLDMSLVLALHNKISVETIVIRAPDELPIGNDTVPDSDEEVWVEGIEGPMDLSKVVIKTMHIDGPNPRGKFRSGLARGMKLARLEISGARLVTQSFAGLRRIDLFLSFSDPIQYSSWLSAFIQASPLTLRTITLHSSSHENSHFVFPFLREARSRELEHTFILDLVVISRILSAPIDPVPTEPFHEWRVTGLKIASSSSLGPVLQLAGAFFPDVSVLTLKFSGGNIRYNIDNCITWLRCFPSLRVLSFHHAFRRLKFGRKRPWEPASVIEVLRTQNARPPSSVEAGMLWYTSRIAQNMPSIKSFFINENHSGGRRINMYPPSGLCDWQVKGWLRVQNRPDGDRNTQAVNVLYSELPWGEIYSGYGDEPSLIN